MSQVKYLIGHTKVPGRAHPRPVTVTVKYANGRLSLTGEIGYRGNDGCGQIRKPEFSSFEPGWNQESVDRLWDIWDRWHLNDMRPGCAHQRIDPDWDTTRKIEITKFGWTKKYYEMRRAAEHGLLDNDGYVEYASAVAPVVDAATLGFQAPKSPADPRAAKALEMGLIEPKGTELKAAGWVDYRTHPEGLLCKPCPVCGYGYGTAWRLEQVPEEIIAWFNAKTHQLNELAADRAEALEVAVKRLEKLQDER